MNVHVWVHTCSARTGSLEPTLSSIRDSDVMDFEVIEAPRLPTPRDVTLWLFGALDSMACRLPDDSLIVRLEDDVIVNRHLRHNVRNWAAVREPTFVAGVLFTMDGNWPPSEMFRGATKSGATYRTDLGNAGSQGQVFKASAIPRMLSKADEALKRLRDDRGDEGMDAHVSRAMRALRTPLFVHFPSLVNCHEGSLVGSDGKRKAAGFFSHGTFDPDWKAPCPSE